MDIRSKLYPYPVLSSANDDYTGSSFRRIVHFDVFYRQRSQFVIIKKLILGLRLDLFNDCPQCAARHIQV